MIIRLAKENYQAMYMLFDCSNTYSSIKKVLRLILFQNSNMKEQRLKMMSIFHSYLNLKIER